MGKHLIITFVVIFSAGGLAILYPSFYDAISLLGGTGCLIICITLPGFIYVKLNEEKISKAKKIFVNFMNFSLTMCGVITTVITFLKNIEAINYWNQLNMIKKFNILLITNYTGNIL